MIYTQQGLGRIKYHVRWLGCITDPMVMNLSKLWEIVRTGEPGVLQPMGSQKVGHDLVTEQQ